MSEGDSFASIGDEPIGYTVEHPIGIHSTVARVMMPISLVSNVAILDPLRSASEMRVPRSKSQYAARTVMQRQSCSLDNRMRIVTYEQPHTARSMTTDSRRHHRDSTRAHSNRPIEMTHTRRSTCPAGTYRMCRHPPMTSLVHLPPSMSASIAAHSRMGSMMESTSQQRRDRSHSSRMNLRHCLQLAQHDLVHPHLPR